MSTAEAARPLDGTGTDPVPIFAALGDHTRLSLLMRLSDGSARSINLLAADTSLTRQAVTKHLRVLQDVGLVNSVRVGRESLYAAHPEALEPARACLDAVAAQWDDALGRLKAFVEE
jgi:DNA-binding transcriptional ArsR family regulator